MDLYWGSGSPHAWRVMLGLLFKGLDYDDHMLSFSEREHKGAGYVTLNPRGKVPTLVDGEVIVTESIAILAYLDHAYRDTPLFGFSAREAARVWRRVMEAENYLCTPATTVVRALFFNRWLRDAEDLSLKMQDVLAELDRLEVDPETGEFNAVDCMLLPLVSTLERASMKAGAAKVGLLPFDLLRWPNLAERMTSIRALPGFERTYPPHWR